MCGDYKCVELRTFVYAHRLDNNKHYFQIIASGTKIRLVDPQ